MRLANVTAAAVLIGLFGAPASAQSLNPTVTVLQQAAGPVPAECVDGTATPVQRAQVDPPPARRTPPPAERDVTPQPVTRARGDAASELRVAHASAVSRDRASYDAAIAAAKSMSSSGDASAVLALFDDVTRLWDYQLNTPSGSFFDANVQGGSLLRALTRHPGYEDFIRRQVITIDGTRFYPTRESIEFLLGLIANRLGGVRSTPTRETATTRSVSPSPAPAPQPRISDSKQKAPARTEVRRAESSTRKTSPVQKSAARSATKRSPRPAPVPPPAPDDDLQTPAGVVATSPAPAADESPASTATTTTTDTGAVTTTADTVLEPAVDTAATTETSATAEPAATSDDRPAQPQERRRSVILPIVLILIGVGVLIVLFRASS